MDRLLRSLLSQFIRRGSITFTTANGTTFHCGDGSGTPVAVRFLTRDAQRRVLMNPELALGEIYMDGDFVVERGSIADLLALAMDGGHGHALRWSHPLEAVRLAWRWLKQFNVRGRAQRGPLCMMSWLRISCRKSAIEPWSSTSVPSM